MIALPHLNTYSYAYMNTNSNVTTTTAPEAHFYSDSRVIGCSPSAYVIWGQLSDMSSHIKQSHPWLYN